MIVEIQRAYTRSPYKLVVGDFNDKLKSNLQNVSKNGKLLEQVINDFDMKVTDTLPICEGQWTRVNNNNSSERSIIDYLLLSEKLEPNLKELLSKTISSYKVTNDKKTYCDHNAFIFNMHTRIKKKNNCNKNKTQWRFKEEVLKKFEQITKDSTIFNNSFTQLSNSINFQKQYDHGKRNSILYDILVLKNINRKRAHNIYQQELTH